MAQITGMVLESTHDCASMMNLQPRAKHTACAEACDSGQAFVRRYAASPTAALMHTIIQPIVTLDAAPPMSEGVKSFSWVAGSMPKNKIMKPCSK